jgi:arthrofactin-type cyclic lipopeptide synthetase C
LYELNVGGPIGIHRQELVVLTPDAQLALMLAKLIEHKVFPARANIAALRAVVRVFAANLNASYQPPVPYLHPMQLVIASDPSESAMQRKDGRHELIEQWRKAAPKVSIWDGPGDHFSLLSPPHVAELAEWMLSKLPRFATRVKA